MPLSEDLRRHGIARVSRAVLFKALGRLVEVSLNEVTNSVNTTDYPPVEGYTNRFVSAEEFRDAAAAQCDGSAGDGWGNAFARGDRCVATFQGTKLVGYNFYSSHPTLVNANTEFFFSDDYLYSYGAYTSPAHRGRGLSPSRWTFARNWRIAHDLDRPTISYIDVTNLASLASGTQSDRITIGLTGYIKIGNLLWHWRSSACRTNRCGFRAAGRPPMPGKEV